MFLAVKSTPSVRSIMPASGAPDNKLVRHIFGYKMPKGRCREKSSDVYLNGSDLFFIGLQREHQCHKDRRKK
jgi:hypothetical protein